MLTVLFFWYVCFWISVAGVALNLGRIQIKDLILSAVFAPPAATAWTIALIEFNASRELWRKP